MKNRKGIMPSRTLAKLYFGIGGFGFAVLLWHILTVVPYCADYMGPDCYERGDWPMLVWIGCIVFCIGLLISDSFARGHFDD